MRISCAILFCASVLLAADQPAKDVRAILDSIRSDSDREASDIEFAPGPSPSAELPLVIELWSQYPDEGAQRFWARFVPNARYVEILMMYHVEYPTSVQDLGSSRGGWIVERGAISTPAYQALLSGFTLATRAVLKSRVGREAKTPPKEGDAGALGKHMFRLGNVWEGGGDWDFCAPDRCFRDGSVNDAGKAFACGRLFRQWRGRVRLRELPGSPEDVVEGFRREMKGCPDWRREARAAYLGWEGDRRDLEALRAIRPRSPVVSRAIRQLELVDDSLHSATGLARLLDATADPDLTFRVWARRVLRSRFSRSYKAKLAREFRSSAETGEQQRLLTEFGRADPDDESLFREAIEHPSPRIRVLAAARLGSWDVLCEIARNKQSRRSEEFYARVWAIGALETVGPEVRNKVGPLLAAMLGDGGEDVRVRGAAAVAMGRMGFREAVPQLLAIVDQPLTERPVVLEEGRTMGMEEYLLMHDLRAAAIRALGLLRARESGARMRAMLAEGTAAGRLDDGGLASLAGESLARIGLAEARVDLSAALCAAGDDQRPSWERRLRLLDSIVAGDLEGIIAVYDGGREDLLANGSYGPCDRYWVDLLAEVARPEDLARFAERRADLADADGELVRKALRR